MHIEVVVLGVDVTASAYSLLVSSGIHDVVWSGVWDVLALAEAADLCMTVTGSGPLVSNVVCVVNLVVDSLEAREVV